MSTKEDLLGLLESHKGIYISGQEIAQKLNVSRAAIWKAVKALREAGYGIDAVTNKGYCLPESTDILSPQGIEKYLLQENQFLTIEVVPTVTSTSTLVRERANSGAPEGYFLASNGQTDGRGRQGRMFYSPQDTGIYFTLLLRPQNCRGEQAARLTTMAAVALCEAVETVSGKSPKIKWVNDIFLDGKKICGILTEGAFNLENGILEYAALGVGINLYASEQGFPPELQNVAGVIAQHPGDDLKNRLTAEFLNRFFAYYRGEREYIPIYREYSLVLGREITILSGEYKRKAVAYGIDDACRLQVRYPDGNTDLLSSGEISIQLENTR